jgi:hypothetical protein
MAAASAAVALAAASALASAASALASAASALASAAALRAAAALAALIPVLSGRLLPPRLVPQARDGLREVMRRS